MKINTKKNHNTHHLRNSFIIFGCIALLAASCLAYIYIFNGNLFGWEKGKPAPTTTIRNVDLNPPTDDQINDGNSSKEESIINEDTKKTDKENVDVSITSINQTESILQIRLLISGTVNPGTCSLTLKGSTNTVSREVDTQSLSNSSTCKGFDIPLSELQAGNWTIDVTYISGQKKGSASDLVIIK